MCKSRTGAEWILQKAETPNLELAVIAPTNKAARDVNINGPSGIITNQKPWNPCDFMPSRNIIFFKNGTRIYIFSSETPARLRGPQFHHVWLDEIVAFEYMDEVWDQLNFCHRLNPPDSPPQRMISTTPMPMKLLVDLKRQAEKGEGVILTTGSTFDNSDNLSHAAIEAAKRRYEGTRLGEQELYGKLLDDIPGALFNQMNINDNRVMEAPELKEIVIAVDPAVSYTKESDATGIVVAGKHKDFYVLEDASLKATPNQYAEKAISLYHKYGASCIVIETNQGGDLLKELFNNADSKVPIKMVKASKGKQIRAESISLLYEQNKVHHVGHFTNLEDEMCTWTPDKKESPDRMDALVWGLAYLNKNLTFSFDWNIPRAQKAPASDLWQPPKISIIE